MKSDLSKVKKGDRIWTIEKGWEEVTDIDLGDKYPIETENLCYTYDGKFNVGDKHPSAFLEYPFKEQEIEKDTLVWYRDDKYSSWRTGYYSHFEDGKHRCFNASMKSSETVATDISKWNIVTTENPLL